MDVITRRPSTATRRVGYLIAIAINLAILYVINVDPGWRAVSFLTEETTEVLGLLNLSIAVGVAANVIYVLTDRPWLKAVGDVVTTTIGLAVIVRVLRVFPFDFGDASFNWAALARAILVLAAIGTGIGIVVQVVLVARLMLKADRPAG